MFSNSVQSVGPRITTSGAPSLTQGAYGRRGNLELLACDAESGLWVFWFNSDLPSDPAETLEVPAGSWSGGLRFAEGTRYTEAQIVQSTLGPNHLEALALTADGDLLSWYWSPGPGFRLRAGIVAGGISHFGLEHADGALGVTVEDGSGGLRHLRSSPHGYPDRRWVPLSDGPGLPDSEAVDAELGALGVDPARILPGTARRAESTRNGGTAEFTWRDASGQIRHLGVPAEPVGP